MPLGLLSSDNNTNQYYFVAKVIPLVVQTPLGPSKLPLNRRRYVTAFEADLIDRKVIELHDLEKNFSGAGRLYRWDLAPKWLNGLKEHYTRGVRHESLDVPEDRKFILVDGSNPVTQENEEAPAEYRWVLWIYIGGPVLFLLYLAYYMVLVVNTIKDRRLMQV